MEKGSMPTRDLLPEFSRFFGHDHVMSGVENEIERRFEIGVNVGNWASVFSMDGIQGVKTFLKRVKEKFDLETLTMKQGEIDGFPSITFAGSW